MSETPVILCRYEGEGEFKPVNSVWARRADAAYVIGEQYYVEPRQARSMNSHRHFFASVNEAWQNLPEPLAKRFKTADHLRRYALIKTGFYLSQQLVCPTKKAAEITAAWIRPAAEYSVITVDGRVVTRFDAKSQNTREMGKEDFQKSKTAVLDFLAELIGTTRKELEGAESA
jgi:hypothetical protein